MGADDPSRVMRSAGGDIALQARHRRLVEHGGTVLVVTAVMGALLLVARPVWAIEPLPDPPLPAALPSLPIPVPSLPLPTLPLPTPPPPVPTVRLPTPTLPPLPTPTLPPPTLPVPTPTLPLPTPTLPLPTPTLPLPTPTLPLPTPTLPLPTPTLPLPTPTGSISPSHPIGASASPSRSPSTAGASPGTSPLASDGAGTGILIGASGLPVDTTGPGGGGPVIVDRSGSSLESLIVPGLLIGVPAIFIIGFLIAQLAVGAAWLPVIRRWLHRRV